MDVKFRDRALEDNSKWFVKRSIDISSWENYDLASSYTTWVRLRSAPLALWNAQFFSYLGLELRRVFAIHPVTLARKNLTEAWLKNEMSNREAT